MKVLKAEHAGACYGVQRALDIAIDTLDEVERAYTFGPLIHNPQVVEDLEKRGAKVAEDIADVEGSTVIIRSHGVMPEVHDQLAQSGSAIVDATCPHVSRAQRAAAELGRSGKHVLVVGEAGHPEVMGLCAYARKEGAEVTVVQSAHDLPADLKGSIGVVVQTTQTRDVLDDVLEALRAQGIDPEVKNTICQATAQRQKATAELASKADAMVVIGGRNSSNTTRLFEICLGYCSRSYHIESADELTPSMFLGCSVVGVTAGASTPEYQISSAIEVIEGYPDTIEGAPIAAVTYGSPAYDAGFEPGCVIAYVNGRKLDDILCWQWESADERIELSYIDLDGECGDIELMRDYGEDWGFEFDGAIFDQIRTCRNACTFCFMRQLPDDLRPSLSVRDDDFRLSFLTGTFATLTNLSEQDERRIIEERISPLRVSLHAVDPDVRERLMGKHAQAGFDALCRLLDAGISFDAQIVLVPDMNSDDVLQQTLDWAYSQPGIANVGIVPLGFTRYQKRFTESFDDAVKAKHVLDIIEPFQLRAQQERGCTWAFGADEFYRNAYGDAVLENLPQASFYGECDMYEDGIGIIRSCVDEFLNAQESGMIARADQHLADAGMQVAYIAGEAMQPYFDQLLDSSGAERISALTVKNSFFGGNVNVTGLLCGCDICEAISAYEKHIDAHDRDTIYLIPSVIFNADGLSLDDMSLDDIRRETRARISISSSNPLDWFQQISDIASGEGA